MATGEGERTDQRYREPWPPAITQTHERIASLPGGSDPWNRILLHTGRNVGA
jgi:hypothetical protein